jgi:GYF domain 2
MPSEWYYARNKKQYGPVSTARLKELADSGELQPTDKVWKEGMPKWLPANTVKGLFAAGAPAPAPAAVAGEAEEEPAASAPRKRSGGIPIWVWLVGGGVLLFLCCGGGLTVGLVAMSGSGVLGGPSLNNLDKIKAGMSEEEVQKLIGPGTVVSDMTFPVGGGKSKHIRTLHFEGKRAGGDMKIDISFEDGKCIYGPAK